MRRAGFLGMVLLAGCDWSLERMVDQERCEPDEGSALFGDGSCNQQRPDGVVRFESPSALTPERSGQDADQTPVATIPIPIDAAGLRRGRQRFETFCGPCHGLNGRARTQVAENMLLRPPPSLHEPRIVGKPDGHIYRVIHEGYGLMPSYERALDEHERWQVVAYVRVLQRSQRTELDALPVALREEAQRWLR
jgi:mono/diheme cytochrome c family protein